MHTDEAVNAVKFGQLLESGKYSYDKNEYHGPAIYYLSLIPAWLTKTKEYPDLNENHLRVVPAIAGIFLMFLLISLKRTTGWKIVIWTSLIAAISPAMVFFSRYYIHEMLLVFFTYVFIITMFQFFKQPRFRWLIAGGISLGLMHATKETFILSAIVLFVALIFSEIIWKEKPISIIKGLRSLKWYHYIVFASVAIVSSTLFFSSFFENPQGVIDSVTTYEGYFSKAGRNEIHQHPWYYYLKILSWNRGPGQIIYSEISILILSAIGIYISFVKKKAKESDQFFRFVAVFSLLLMLLYSLIPYKTPWNMLSFYFGFILMAGYGLVEGIKRIQNNRSKIIMMALFGISIIQLCSQVFYSNYIFSADPLNPYVYGHTSQDIYYINQRVRDVVLFHPDGKDLYMQVISSNSDYWPLPWYLRDFSNVGWWDHIDFESPLAPLIIVSPDQEELVVKKIYEMPKPGEKYLYVPLFDEGTELRPGVEVFGYLRNDYWVF